MLHRRATGNNQFLINTEFIHVKEDKPPQQTLKSWSFDWSRFMGPSDTMRCTSINEFFSEFAGIWVLAVDFCNAWSQVKSYRPVNCAGFMFLSITVVSTAMYVIYSLDVPAIQDPKVNLCWRINAGRLELSRLCQVMIKSFPCLKIICFSATRMVNNF